MRIPMTCMQCSIEAQNDPNPLSFVSRVYPQFLEINNLGVYEATCSQGHTTSTISQQHKHETLFEIASFAILDGYYREAISSFASSLERFYEFIIDFLLCKRDCSDSLIDTAWSSISSQSERQLGAFIILYTSTFGCVPNTLSNKHANVRNNVIHKGQIPSREDAVAFGEAVLGVMRPSLQAMREKFPDFTVESVLRRLTKLGVFKEGSPHNNHASMCSPSILDQGNENKTLSDYLSGQSSWHAMMLFQRYLDSPDCNLVGEIQTAQMLGKLNLKDPNCRP